MGCTTTYLTFVNVVSALVGLGVIITGIYVIIQGNQSFPEAMGYAHWQSWVAVGVGAGIFLMSCIGCCCESSLRNQCIILCFGFFQLTFGLAVLTAGSGLTALSGEYIDTIAASQTATRGIPAGPFGLQAHMSDFMLGLFTGCCSQFPNGTQPALLECTDDNSLQEYNGKRYCYKNEGIFESGVEAGEQSLSGYCELEDLVETCPSNIPWFLGKNQTILNVYFWPAGVALVVFGLLLFLASICSCRLGWLSKRKFYEAQQENLGGVPLTREERMQMTHY